MARSRSKLATESTPLEPSEKVIGTPHQVRMGGVPGGKDEGYLAHCHFSTIRSGVRVRTTSFSSPLASAPAATLLRRSARRHDSFKGPLGRVLRGEREFTSRQQILHVLPQRLPPVRAGRSSRASPGPRDQEFVRLFCRSRSRTDRQFSKAVFIWLPRTAAR